MTLINCTINKSGTTEPLVGYVGVTSNNYLSSGSVFYTSSLVKYPLVNGTVQIELVPTDVAQVAYNFKVIAVDPVDQAETEVYAFEATVPYSATPINLNTLAPQSGIRYDRRDASLLTLARFLSSNESFVNFLGGKLWSNKGNFNPATVYKRGNVVLYQGSSYQYVSESQSAGIVPGTDDAVWVLLAAGQSADASGGGLVVFNTLATRPNWGTAEAGRTAVFSRTGNLHRWSGTAWTVLGEDSLNVLDWGVTGDGVTDDSIALQGLLNQFGQNSGKQREVFFPSGTYLFNVLLPWNCPNIRGEGQYSTKFSSFTPTGWVFTSTRNNNWVSAELSDFTIEGPATLTKNGIQWGETVFRDFQQYGAGLVLSRISFVNLNIAMYKRYGNIGNTFNYIYATTCNYHYIAEGFPGSPGLDGMNSGCDTFYKGQFDSAQICSIHYDGKNSGVNAQVVLRDTIIENCPGFGLYVRRFDNQGNFAFSPSVVLDQSWFEYCGSAASVNFRGTAMVPRTLKFEEANVRIDGCQLFDLELIKSKVTAVNVGIGVIAALEIIRDAASFFVADGVETAIGDTPHYLRDLHYRPIGGAYTTWSYGPARLKKETTADNVGYSNSFNHDIVCTSVAGVAAPGLAKPVRDGLMFPRCQEIAINATNNTVDYFLDTTNVGLVPRDKYVFWSAEIKKVSGDDLGLSFARSWTACNNLPMSQSGWQTVIGLGDSLNASTAMLQVGFRLSCTGKVGTIRIGAVQMLYFDTLQQLQEFALSLAFRCPREPSVMFGSSPPAAGSEYVLNDIIYNTNTATGQPRGWICVEGGTNSVWETLGRVMVGSQILMLATATPTEYLKCDGSAVSRALYPKLFAAIGTAFGAGDGSTTFNLPDAAITGDSTFFVYTG